MGEEEYIKLNDLLTKYRQKMLSQIRSIDNLRKNMILICDEEVEEICSNE